MFYFPQGGGGGDAIYTWMGRSGPAPHTLTLFKTKIAGSTVVGKHLS